LNNKKIIYLTSFLIFALFIISNCQKEEIGNLSLKKIKPKPPLLKEDIDLSNLNKISNEEGIIEGCGTIDTAGRYYLENDIINTNRYGVCIPVYGLNTGDKIVIDCKGHSIIEPRGVGAYSEVIEPIFDISNPQYPEIVMQNCNFINWFQALSIRTSNSHSINNNFYNNFYSLVVATDPILIEPYGVILEGNNFINKLEEHIYPDILFDYVKEANLKNNYLCSSENDVNIYCEREVSFINGDSSYHYTNCKHKDLINNGCPEEP